METSLTLDPRTIPADGVRLTGELAESALGLAAEDPAKPSSPIVYELLALRDDDNVLLSGVLRAGFKLDCVRCLNTIDFEVLLENYRAEIPIENDQIIDLTECLREDILFTLPSYPRCEDGNVFPVDCSAEDRFDSPLIEEPERPIQPDNIGAWEALDQLKR